MTIRLIDLEPRWLTDHLFMFKCPCCQRNWLGCKDIPMTYKEQFALYEKVFGDNWNRNVVPSKPSFSWKIVGRDFNTLTVTPSIDASNSGGCTWHGFITKGIIT